MLNAPHILETALLILAAFLIGCVIGYLARRLTLANRRPAEPVIEMEAAPAQAPAPELVVAPTIAPLPKARPRRSAAKRLAAAADREPDETVPIAVAAPVPGEPAAAQPAPASAPAPAVEQPPVAAKMQPARTAGAATSGIVVPAPFEAPLAEVAPEPEVTAEPAAALAVASEPAAVPEVAPEPPPGPVRAEDVPPIDEAAHVVETPVAATPSAELLAAVVETEAEPAEPEGPVPPREDTEAAAMRAVEGGSTPRRTRVAPRRPVPHPEQASAEVDAAMATARTAVAAATAAANAALAEASEPEPEGIDFEPGPDAFPESFLAGEPEPDSAASGKPALDFEPERPRFGYGRPEGLPEPRHGGKDNLKQIKGITPSLESSLNGLGIFHFDQIAAWDQKAIVWLDHNLTLKGRIGRERWLEQARDLARGRPHPVRPVRR